MAKRTTIKGLRAVHVRKKQMTQADHAAAAQRMLEEMELRRASVPAQPFDPGTLLEEARRQWAAMPELAEAFARCTQEWRESELYTHFLSPAERKTRWNYVTNVPLAHPAWGTLVVDIIRDATVAGGYAIGGIEYLDRVMGRHVPIAEFLRWFDVAHAHFTAKKQA